ncbi:MAG: PSD1 and planctomycete cytochrome C domain-containing protein [Planctomycetaceae bacterium]
MKSLDTERRFSFPRCRSAAVRLLAGIAVCGLGATLSAANEVDFAKDVRPILQARCIKCHGPEKQKSSLRVDSRTRLLAGGDSGPAIIPGDPEHSYLVELVSSADQATRMPPKGDPLSAEQIAKIRQWIREGAKWPMENENPQGPSPHWAFVPVRPFPIPRLGRPDSQPNTLNPIDSFLLADLARRGLQMSSEADPRTFIRRATLDLIGLPPTPDEVQEFVRACNLDNDTSPKLPDGPVKRLIDRLLASPRYGERWAQHWLDVIRYADTNGYEKNALRPSAWPYRDYVIAAFNADIPYPQFLVEQLAGDVLGVDPATGFLVTPPFPTRIEIGQEAAAISQARFNGLDEVLQNVGSALLGLTVGCARCHDHKFDPVSVHDYYRLAATFDGLRFADRPWRGGAMPTEQTRGLENRLAEIRSELSAFPSTRESEPTQVTDFFPPVNARWMRLVIAETFFKRDYAPAFDEIEVWGAADRHAPASNLGAAATGAVARSSGADPVLGGGDCVLNDGKRGGDSLWIAAGQLDAGNTPWVEIELPQPALINRVTWSCDPDDQVTSDRVPLRWRTAKRWRIEAASQPGQWHTLVSPDRADNLSPDDADRRNRLEQEFAETAMRLRELTHVFAGRFKPAGPMHILRRGDPQQPREPTGPGAVEVLGGYELPLDTPDSERRLALAKWLGNERHPLTARVLVNRVWRHHFGAGIVDTPSDFGTQGELPTHPELLDWLAYDLMSSGWRLKELHRLICTSAAYRQSSRPDQGAYRIDADTRLLWRFPPRRLEAEVIRDSILFASGSLDTTMGGPGISVYEPVVGSASDVNVWDAQDDPGPQSWRRMIYLLRVRGADDGVFKPFDVPDCGQVRPKRGESTTPLQALNLFNSPFVSRQAQRLAERARREGGDDVARQIERIFNLTLARPPGADELAACLAAVEQDSLESVCRALFNSNEFLFLE